MKKILFSMVLLLTTAVASQAMSYEQARQQALFLADKMAYELNLTEEQYEACYEINLDYLMGIRSEADLYGDYWRRRNLDMSYILLDWQYSAFIEAAYFYRPIYWSNGYWRFGVYARYPHRDYFYYGCPTFWGTYRGGHAWHHNGGRSWYHGRSFGFSNRSDRNYNHGMRDRYNNGNYSNRGNMNRDYRDNRRYQENSSRSSFDRIRTDGRSSTRTTVGNQRPVTSNRYVGEFTQPSRSYNSAPSVSRSVGGSINSSGSSAGSMQGGSTNRGGRR